MLHVHFTGRTRSLGMCLRVALLVLLATPMQLVECGHHAVADEEQGEMYQQPAHLRSVLGEGRSARVDCSLGSCGDHVEPGTGAGAGRSAVDWELKQVDGLPRRMLLGGGTSTNTYIGIALGAAGGCIVIAGLLLFIVRSRGGDCLLCGIAPERKTITLNNFTNLNDLFAGNPAGAAPTSRQHAQPKPHTVPVRGQPATESPGEDEVSGVERAGAGGKGAGMEPAEPEAELFKQQVTDYELQYAYEAKSATLPTVGTSTAAPHHQAKVERAMLNADMRCMENPLNWSSRKLLAGAIGEIEAAGDDEVQPFQSPLEEGEGASAAPRFKLELSDVDPESLQNVDSPKHPFASRPQPGPVIIPQRVSAEPVVDVLSPSSIPTLEDSPAAPGHSSAAAPARTSMVTLAAAAAAAASSRDGGPTASTTAAGAGGARRTPRTSATGDVSAPGGEAGEGRMSRRASATGGSGPLIGSVVVRERVFLDSTSGVPGQQQGGRGSGTLPPRSRGGTPSVSQPGSQPGSTNASMTDMGNRPWEAGIGGPKRSGQTAMSERSSAPSSRYQSFTNQWAEDLTNNPSGSGSVLDSSAPRGGSNSSATGAGAPAGARPRRSSLLGQQQAAPGEPGFGRLSGTGAVPGVDESGWGGPNSKRPSSPGIGRLAPPGSNDGDPAGRGELAGKGSSPSGKGSGGVFGAVVSFGAMLGRNLTRSTTPRLSGSPGSQK